MTIHHPELACPELIAGFQGLSEEFSEMSSLQIKYILSVLFFLLPMLLRAQENTYPRGEDLEIKLVTIGPGDDVPSWWGHTALIVEDRRFKSSVFYNYGLFSFEEKNFFVNFAMGRLIFWVGAWKTVATVH